MNRRMEIDFRGGAIETSSPPLLPRRSGPRTSVEVNDKVSAFGIVMHHSSDIARAYKTGRDDVEARSI
jgi:hypothetical protein